MRKGKVGPLPALSEVQLEMMQEVWERGEVTVSEVWGAVVEQRPVARNTILTMMERLTKKGWLKRRSEKKTHFYRATVTRESTLGEVVSRLVETAFAGSADSLVLALLEGRGVSAEEAARIRKLIDQSRREKGGKKK